MEVGGRGERGAGTVWPLGTGEAGLGLGFRICASWRFRAFVFLGAAFCARCRVLPSWSGRPEEAAPRAACPLWLQVPGCEDEEFGDIPGWALGGWPFALSPPVADR